MEVEHHPDEEGKFSVTRTTMKYQGNVGLGDTADVYDMRAKVRAFASVDHAKAYIKEEMARWSRKPASKEASQAAPLESGASSVEVWKRRPRA